MSGMKIDAAMVKKRISESLQIPLEKLKDEKLVSDVVTESFAVVEMVIDLQEEFEIVLGQDDLKKVKTIGQLVELIVGRAAGMAAAA